MLIPEFGIFFASLLKSVKFGCHSSACVNLSLKYKDDKNLYKVLCAHAIVYYKITKIVRML